jgi:hypothetical protein
MLKYLFNGFLLFLPVFLWNAVLFKKLPPYYQPQSWDRIPKGLDAAENILRILTFLLPLLFSIGFRTKVQIAGWILYLAGLTLYFVSWVVQINGKNNRWHKGLLFRTAPAFTTIFWLTGIGLAGGVSWLPWFDYRRVYFPVMMAFTAVHLVHACLVSRASTADGH